VNKHALEAFVAAAIAAFIGVLLTPAWNDFWVDWKSVLGAPLLTLIGVLCILVLVVLSLAALHYFGVLGAGADPLKTRTRKDYDALRQRIASGNWIAREYARRLTIFLDAVDRFFGDAGMPERSLFPRAFGLETPAPLWTAPAFDRCLVLALLYPIAAIFLVWAVSNHIGPAEAALRLKGTDDWRRAIGVAMIGFAVFAGWRAIQTTRWWFLAWCCVAFAFAFALAAGAGTAAISVAVIGAIAGFIAGARIGVFAIAGIVSVTAIIIGAIAVALVGASASTNTIAVGITISGATFLGVAIVTSNKYEWQGIFMSLFFLLMFLACLTSALLLSSLPGWHDSGPLLLFLGLLTLLNAPFDWFSLGLTRALLRRGLEKEKWWPYWYAVVDAVLASLVIALLAITMVVGVQVFDDLAVYGGGSRVLPPMREFLDAIRAAPEKPEYWWVYATLFSTMLPSLINLFIAGVSLARGVPGVSSWLLRKMKKGEAVPNYDRLLVALVLTFQGVIGFAIAVVAQGFLFWVIIWQAMPRLGFGILDLAYRVAH
jgi:hypothetical protein